MQSLKNKVLIAIILILLRTGPAFAGTVDTTELIQALIQVESRGNDRAFGDRTKEEKAYGPLQVRQPCVDDVNRRYGTTIKAKDLLGDRAKSTWVCQKYLEMYATQKQLGKEPTYEDMARIWNGGPHGWKRSNTVVYWSKVNRQLEKIQVAQAKMPKAKATPATKPESPKTMLAVMVKN
jgi:hypothetical protein